MSEEIRITVLVDNSVGRRGLAAEHGLAFHIQAGARSLLFDTGQTELVRGNAEALGLPLDRIEAVVLSHGHYDHTGGLPAVLKAAPEAKVFLHPAAFDGKYSRSTGEARFIGMSPDAIQAVRQQSEVVETAASTEVAPGIFATGEIPRLIECEDVGGAFFLDAACLRPDPLADDQALVIDLGRSVVVLLGCAHAGAINTLIQVRRLTGGKPVRGVIGGFHLGSASEGRLQQTLSRLGELNLECLSPLHCTGWPALAALGQAFPESFQPGVVGTVFRFERS